MFSTLLKVAESVTSASLAEKSCDFSSPLSARQRHQFITFEKLTSCFSWMAVYPVHLVPQWDRYCVGGLQDDFANKISTRWAKVTQSREVLYNHCLPL